MAGGNNIDVVDWGEETLVRIDRQHSPPWRGLLLPFIGPAFFRPQ